MKVEFELADGSGLVINDAQDPWGEVEMVEACGAEIISAWRDDEPWFGKCTDMREGQP